MKKLLLLLCAFFSVVSINAQYNVNDYIYTTTAKYKVTKILSIPSPGTDWHNYSSEIFSPFIADTEEDYNGIMSTRSDEGDFISYALPIVYGKSYIISLKYKAISDGSTSITNGALNQIDAWISSQDDQGARVGLNNIDYSQVAATTTVIANEWTNISWAFTDTLAVNATPEEENKEPGGFLNILFSRITTESIIASDIQVAEVIQVYDTRISDAYILFAKQIMNDPNFNTESAAEARATLEEDIAAVEAASIDGTFDDQTAAEEYIATLQESVNEFMNFTSTDFTKEDYFRYITDISVVAKYSRTGIADGATIGGFLFKGPNWSHSEGAPYWSKGIHGGYSDSAGTISLTNANFPAGKYFFSVEVRNAVYASGYIRQYTLENEVKMFIGNDTISCGMIKGEQFVKFYHIAEIKEGETFDVGVWYPGYTSGSIFDAMHFEIRGFGDIAQRLERQTIWNSFSTQWNEAVKQRQALLEKVGSNDYPWEQDTIQHTLNKWDPLYNAVQNVWVDENGNDLGTATNAELEEWAIHQGFYPEEEDPDYNLYSQYALVRGYQYTNAYLESENHALVSLSEAIAESESIRDDDLNSTGNKDIINNAVDKAKEVLDDIKNNSNDSRRESDESAIDEQIELLKEANSKFLASIEKISPFIDIEFSGGFTTILEEEDSTQVIGYVINGQSDFYPQGKGQMTFNGVSSVSNDNQEDSKLFQIGFQGMFDTDSEATLRVGNSAATVEFGEENLPTDEDVIRAQFDLWFGNLSGKYLTVELQNAAGERVAGFSINRYKGIVAYNDFNNQTGAWNDITESKENGGTGMDIKRYSTGLGSSSVSNAAICVENNRSSFDLIIDYKANAIKGTIVNSKNGTCNGEFMPMTDVYSNPNLTDNKVSKFVIKSDYGTGARRCWFDNLQIFKYPSQAEEALFEKVEHSIPGDVNKDKNVDISDIVAVINLIAAGEFQIEGDVNMDQKIDISDIVAIINIIAGVN